MKNDHVNQYLGTSSGFSISVIENSLGKPLSKRRYLDKEGNLAKVACAELVDGQVSKKVLSSLRGLCELMSNLEPNSAVTFGNCSHSIAKILSRKRASAYKGKEPVVTRTREEFFWPAGPGIILLDYDPAPESRVLNAHELIDALRSAVPELKNITMAAKPSVSSCIYDENGKEHAGIRGLHVFFVCKDASKIPEIGKLIYKRLWLAGFGYIRLSEDGRMMERSLIDTSVWQPERLVFGRAFCGRGLVQKFPVPYIFSGDMDDINGETWLEEEPLPELTKQEEETLGELIQKARNEKQLVASEKRNAWADKRAKESAGENALPEIIEQHKISILHFTAEGNVLPPEMLLYTQFGGTVSVSEILENRDKWHEKRFFDPFEPSYGNDNRIAVAYLKGCEEPHIYSHAHGGQKYLLRTEDQRRAETLSEFEFIVGSEQQRRRLEAVQAAIFAAGENPGWLIKGILPKTGVAMIFGKSGVGKSFFALDMVGAIAQGILWFGHKVCQGSVVYVAAEGAYGFRKRLVGYARHNGLDLAQLPIHVIQDTPDLQKSDDLHISEEIKRLSAKVIVIDTLAQSIAGANENSGEDMGPIINRCKNIYEQTGALVLLIHHAGKDEAKGARGWSGIRAAMDAEIEISVISDGIVARVTKQKDGETGKQFFAKLVQISLGKDEDGEEITTCIIEETPGFSFPVKKHRGKWTKIVLDVIEQLSETEERIAVAKILTEASKRMTYDPGPDLNKPKRDSRRDSALRGLEKLIEENEVIMKDNQITIPQFRNLSQPEDCGTADSEI